jgi:hypothetical protein
MPTYGELYHPALYRATATPTAYSHDRFKAPPPPSSAPEPEPAPVIRVARNYDEYRRALDDRRTELGLSMLDLDHCGSMPSGYSSKILTSSRMRDIGPGSFGKLLDGLDLEIHLVPRSPSSDDSPSENQICPHKQLLRERGRAGAAARTLKTNPQRRSMWARKAARVRWSKRAKLANAVRPSHNPTSLADRPHRSG